MPMPLTRTDIMALRKADDILFRHTADGTIIHAFKKATTDDDPFEGTAQIACKAIFGGAWTPGMDKRVCSANVSHSRNCLRWQTIVSLMREGDELVAVWYENGHRNQHVENAGLHADALYLRIQRDGKYKHEFLVDTVVCPDNSARMIRMA